MSNIAILGGTGALGSALARRWARAGYKIWIGSRSVEKGRAAAAALATAVPGSLIQGTDMEGAANESDIIVLAVPYASHEQTLAAVQEACTGKIIIDTTVPLRPPKVGTVQLPAVGCAALEAQNILGDRASVVSALQTVSAQKLGQNSSIDCDVLVTGDNKEAVDIALKLISDLGLRAFNAGPLANSAAPEALTSVLIQLNRKYFSHAGIKVTGDPRGGSDQAPRRKLSIWPLSDLPLIKSGDDLAQMIGNAITASSTGVESGDVIVVAQKIVSKAEGRTVPLDTVIPSPEAQRLATKSEKDARSAQLILDEAEHVMRETRGVVIVRHRLGHVAANAGIDASNVGSQDRPDQVLLWPQDPDASASKLRVALQLRFNVNVAVIISDSIGRAWRMGTIGTAIGSAGIEPLTDRRGERDLYGRILHSTIVGRADEIAAAASLVIGEADEGTPVAILRGVSYRASEQSGIRGILRPLGDDLFP